MPEVLKEFEDEFFQVVYAKYNLLKLVRKEVITQDIATRISATYDDEGKEILYHHLKHHGSVHTLREFCETAIAADGYPNMQKLAEKILQKLPQEGWLHSSVHLCKECMHVWVRVWICACENGCHFLYMYAAMEIWNGINTCVCACVCTHAFVPEI